MSCSIGNATSFLPAPEKSAIACRRFAAATATEKPAPCRPAHGAQPPVLPGLSDQAAVARMDALMRAPKEELRIVRKAISESFHRLYRQRNLILHAGKLDSVALIPGLRTVAKLAGAGVDRVTHGHYVQKLKPLDLVARANIALQYVDSSNPLACIELLGTT